MIDHNSKSRQRIALGWVGLWAALGCACIDTESTVAQTYYDDLTHKPPPMPPPETCNLAPILSVESAEIHHIEGDTAIITADGTAADDSWRDEQLKLAEEHDGTAVYDFLACPPKERKGVKIGVDAFVPDAKIRGIHRVVIRAETNQQFIDVDAARRVPDPWSRVPPQLPNQDQ